MKREILDFFSLQRQIFGLCPHCNELFRLSECDIYLKQRPPHDWLTAIDREMGRLDDIEARITPRFSIPTTPRCCFNRWTTSCLTA